MPRIELVDSWPRYHSLSEVEFLVIPTTAFEADCLKYSSVFKNILKAGNVTIQSLPLFKLEISSCFFVFKFMLSSFPALRMAMALSFQ